jgi:hypothetical protein
MHLSMDELIALPVAGKLAELLEGQLGNDFCAYMFIIPMRVAYILFFIYTSRERAQRLRHRVFSVAGSGFSTVAEKNAMAGPPDRNRKRARNAL